MLSVVVRPIRPMMAMDRSSWDKKKRLISSCLISFRYEHLGIFFCKSSGRSKQRTLSVLSRVQRHLFSCVCLIIRHVSRKKKIFVLWGPNSSACRSLFQAPRAYLTGPVHPPSTARFDLPVKRDVTRARRAKGTPTTQVSTPRNCCFVFLAAQPLPIIKRIFRMKKFTDK
jgi:hypothetical protein